MCVHFRWKVITDDDESEQLSVELEQCNETGESPENEDISDECLVVKHDKALLEERKKFETYLKFPLTSRSRANRRIDSRGNDSSGANTPITDPTSPMPMVLGEIEVRNQFLSSHASSSQFCFLVIDIQPGWK
jgi:hypothetical protein